MTQPFSLTVPPTFNFAVDVVDRWAEDPGKLAMLWVNEQGEERRLTFRDFQLRSNQVANLLRDLGVKPGDRIVVVLPRIPEWWETILGIMRVGGIAVPGTVLLTAKDLQYRISASGATVAITDVENAPKVDEIAAACPTLRHRVVVGWERSGWTDYDRRVSLASSEFDSVPTRSNDPCLIYFTSGTTGPPKMVVHTHASYPIGHRITGEVWLGLTPSDLHWTLSDTGWAKAAWTTIFAPWNMGAAVFIADHRGKFSATTTLDLLAHYPITTFCAPPTAYRLLILEDLTRRQFPHLRHCVGAGEPLNPEVIEVWRNGTGLMIHEGYGQTETVLLVGTFPGMTVKPGSMGVPAPGFDVAVVDEDGKVVSPGVEGDIAIRIRPERPVGLFTGYWATAEATADCERGDWYITKDRAYTDDDGYLWFVGRADDVIISASYRIGPFEVESALLEHPAVAEAAVIGAPDPVRGQIVKAFVMLAPGFESSDALIHELQEHVKKIAAPYKYPREIEFVAELPKTISGKIRRVELRERR
ncbi:MAG: AMP-binding protein [Candidatus Latescibacteria bacterium]|nr:AMP-binding protein [Candidatus Latescibacterota bacterium]